MYYTCARHGVFSASLQYLHRETKQGRLGLRWTVHTQVKQG